MSDIKKIGEHLIDAGVIREQDVASALERQHQTGAKLGEILLAEGKISAFKFYKELAEHKKLPFIDLDKYSLNFDIINESFQDEYIERQYIPFDQVDGRLFIATANPDDLNISYLRDKFGDFDLYITSPYDILWSLQKRFADIDIEDAKEIVEKNLPEFSSKNLVFSDFSVFAFYIIFACILFAMTNEYIFTTFIILSNIFFLSVLLSKICFVLKGALFQPKHKAEEESFSLEINEGIYPLYSILVPLYHENERTVNQLIKGLKNLDYPQERLDIKFVVEIDDVDTADIIKSLKPPSNYQIIRVPYSLPRTKPKACNYALKYCKGEYITIYDAEDQPDPQQLKKALRILNKGGKIASVQARLNYYNKDENLLSSLFAIEYSTWFDFMLYGLRSMKLPIPLGGTSNHFTRETLKSMHAWDPYNVTEDADLGIRITVAGLETELTDSLTLEEAPIHLSNWFTQRTRWLKGYIQTFFVNIKNYSLLKKNVGARGIAGLFFFVAAPFMIYILVPLVALTSLIAYIIGNGLPEWVEMLCLINLYTSIIFHFVLGSWVVIKNKWWGQSFAALYFPFYWVLHCIAAYLAFYEFLKKPHHWNKTEHGLSSIIPEIVR